MSSIYSPNKASKHPASLAILQAGGQPNPVHVQLVISDLCNESCKFCSYRMEDYSSNQLFKVIQPDGRVNNNPNRMIPLSKVKEIVDDCATMGVKAIQITGGGEPTVHPDFGTICRYIADKAIAFSVVTNGVLMHRYTEELSLATWIRVSVDAGNSVTYSQMRQVKPSVFDKVWANVASFARAKSQTVMGIGFVVTADNYKEVEDATKMAIMSGAANMRVSAFFQNAGQQYYEHILDECREQLIAANDVARQHPHFTLFNNFEERVDDLHGRPDYKDCGYMQFTTYIGGDQNVYTCCVQSYNEKGLIGSLKEQSFAELWASQPKKDMFATFDARGCERCMFNSKNKSIAAALVTGPHDNFV